MLIIDIYARYKIPPNVVRHQFDVAAIGRYLCENWNRPIDEALVTPTLLLHDMGNIIKFKRPFMGELEDQEKYWESIQEEYFAKYGHDVHECTMAIISELGLPKVRALIDEMHRVWSEPSGTISDEARLCEFADCCVTPSGITTFEMRIDDLKKRYGYVEGSGAVPALRANFEVVKKRVPVDLDAIPSIDFSKDIENLKTINL